MTLSSSIDNFLKYLQTERQAQPKTIENYQHYLNKFLEFSRSTGSTSSLQASSGQAGDIPLSSLDLVLVKKYRLYLAKEPLKKITQNYFMIALRAYLKFLKEQGVEVLEAEDVKLGLVETQKREALDKGSVTRLLQGPNITSKVGLRDKALLETLVSTGLKVSELAGLNRGAINFDQKELVVVKRKGQRKVCFSDSASHWLGQYLRARRDTFNPLFIRFQGKVSPKDEGEKMRLTPRSIQRIVEKYVQETGLSIKATPSILRHSFAKDTLQKGEDLRSLQSHLGHKHLSSTQVYTELD